MFYSFDENSIPSAFCSLAIHENIVERRGIARGVDGPSMNLSYEIPLDKKKENVIKRWR